MRNDATARADRVAVARGGADRTFWGRLASWTPYRSLVRLATASPRRQFWILASLPLLWVLSQHLGPMLQMLRVSLTDAYPVAVGEDFVARVKDITGGQGVDVVYDSVGQDTYPGSLDCLKPLGMWVSFGQTSGPITNFNLADLAQKGSLFATRPTLFNYVARREDLEQSANDLFNVVSSGRVKIPLHQEFPLAEAAKAHEALEGRKTTGASILTV